MKKTISIVIPDNALLEVKDNKVFLHIKHSEIKKIQEKIKIELMDGNKVLDEKNLIIYDERKIELGE